MFSAESLFSVKGKVALVTGGGTGIGLTAAKALASNGAKVYIVGRRKEKLDEAVEATKNLSGSIVALQGDVADKESLKSIANGVEEGYLDILINNAGIEGPVSALGDNPEKLSGADLSKIHLDNENFEKWDNLFRINTSSLFFATMTFLPLLEASPKGSTPCITNKTSISGSVKWSQQHYAYNASKAAANSLTLMMAYEFNFKSKLNIRVNALAPGLFETEMTQEMVAKGPGESNPAGRVGTEEEMANAILFFVTNSFLQGQIIAVDGGFQTAAPSCR